MRTALVLLFLLAVASVPGSVLPQEGIDPSAVAQYYAAHPALAPILARLSLFSVFAAPWFAAIYLLLFASLAGCVLPRTFRLVGSARQLPPQAPRNLARLPLTASYRTPHTPASALESAGQLLSGKRFRLRTGDGWVAAEKGYLREVGNLIFHIALLALLGAVAIGGLFGYKANRLLVVGSSFANTPTALDQFRPGRLVSPADLQPFSVTLENFTASYVTSGLQRGQPSAFDAAVSYTAAPGDPVRKDSIRVNHPLQVDDVRVYLIGHGYAPIFRITDGTGRAVFNQPVPFIPVEQAGFTSDGVIKVPDASPTQLGFAGVFLPTMVDVGGTLRSAFPAALNPRVSLLAYGGNLGMNTGQPQSVYQLDTAGLHRLAIAPERAVSRPVHEAAWWCRHDHVYRVPAVDQPGDYLRPRAAARPGGRVHGAGRPAAVVPRQAPQDIRACLPGRRRDNRGRSRRPCPVRCRWWLRGRVQRAGRGAQWCARGRRPIRSRRA